MKKVLNIVLASLFAITVALVLWAVVVGGADAAISWNLIWFYALLVGAVVCIVGAAIANLIQNPSGLKTTGVAAVLVVAIVGAATGIAMSHEGLTIPNSAGGVFDDPFVLIVSEAGIIVTYVVAVATILATVVAEVRNLFK